MKIMSLRMTMMSHYTENSESTEGKSGGEAGVPTEETGAVILIQGLVCARDCSKSLLLQVLQCFLIPTRSRSRLPRWKGPARKGAPPSLSSLTTFYLSALSLATPD